MTLIHSTRPSLPLGTSFLQACFICFWAREIPLNYLQPVSDTSACGLSTEPNERGWTHTTTHGLARGGQLPLDPTSTLTLAWSSKFTPREKGTRFLSPPQHHEHLGRILLGRLSQTTIGFRDTIGVVERYYMPPCALAHLDVVPSVRPGPVPHFLCPGTCPPSSQRSFKAELLEQRT
jgi:hypothetical protein